MGCGASRGEAPSTHGVGGPAQNRLLHGGSRPPNEHGGGVSPRLSRRDHGQDGRSTRSDRHDRHISGGEVVHGQAAAGPADGSGGAHDRPALFSGERDTADRWTFKRTLRRQRRQRSRRGGRLPTQMVVAPFTAAQWDALPLGDAVWPDDLPAGTSDLNRFKNVLPNPNSRVVLADLTTISAERSLAPNTSDTGKYINANYIHGARMSPNEPSRPRCYIATQGPLCHTIGDFWHMVWQEQATVIIMVTGLTEGGKVKCARYWPEMGGDALVAAGFCVSVIEASRHAGITLTKLEVTNTTGESRVVHHFWHDRWPDHDQPDNPTSSAAVVLQMLVCARRLGPTSAAPWIVHCSAGVGRSGTVISIDYGIDLLTSTATCDVAKIISAIRRDRTHLVASFEQAVFVWEALSLYADVYNRSFLSLERRHTSEMTFMSSASTIDEDSADSNA